MKKFYMIELKSEVPFIYEWKKEKTVEKINKSNSRNNILKVQVITCTGNETDILIKGYPCYKMITSQNVLPEALVKNFFIL